MWPVFKGQLVCLPSPAGTGWKKVDGRLKHVSVSNKGHVWGVSAVDNIFIREGTNNSNPGGTNWKQIPGKLKQISVGKSGVWGVNAQNHIYYRTGTYGDSGSEGSGWQQVSGRFLTRNALLIAKVISGKNKNKS